MAADQREPLGGKIVLERGASSARYLLTLTTPDGSDASVIINRTLQNQTALEYFFEKLKGGISI
jgi:hypothetical protein